MLNQPQLLHCALPEAWAAVDGGGRDQLGLSHLGFGRIVAFEKKKAPNMLANMV